MAGYLGTRAVLLSTTAADVTGDMTVAGDATVSGAFTSLGIDDNATSTAITIDASENVGIGTDSPSYPVSVQANSSAKALLILGRSSDDIGEIAFRENDNSTVLGELQYRQDHAILRHRVGYLSFATGGTSERMKIDASGNLLLGKTAVGLANSGVELREGAASGFTRNSTVMDLNRTGGDGEIMRFRKDGSTVGRIGSNGSRPYFYGGSGIKMGLGGVQPCNSNGSNSDNDQDLGSATVRWDDVYATNGTIQTSDRNEKQQVAALTTAEITAAKAISAGFKTFKWNDSVAEKGAEARTHSGVIAQEVEQALTDAGLDAGDYAFFISNTWWETHTEVPAVEAVEAAYEDVVIPAVLDADGNELEAERTEQRLVTEAVEAKEAYTRTDTYHTLAEAPEGATERTRKGIRYPQLLAFVGAATEQRLASIETRLAALEV